MPLDRFVLIIVVVLAAAAATIWLGAVVAASLAHPVGWAVLVPVALVAYVLWRVIADRLGDRADDKYDRIEK